MAGSSKSLKLDTADDFLKVTKQVLLQSHAAAVLVMATRLEVKLEELLQSRMPNLSNKLRRKLFEGFGPFSSFSAKIDVAYSMKLISSDLHHDLHAIRDIRNTFAHTYETLSFDDQKSSNWSANYLRPTEPAKSLKIASCRFIRTAAKRSLLTLLSHRPHHLGTRPQAAMLVVCGGAICSHDITPFPTASNWCVLMEEEKDNPEAKGPAESHTTSMIPLDWPRIFVCFVIIIANAALVVIGFWIMDWYLGTEIFQAYFLKHFALLVGVPAAVQTAFAVVLLTYIGIRGQAKMKVFGAEISGPAAPVLLFIFCFLAIVLGIKTLAYAMDDAATEQQVEGVQKTVKGMGCTVEDNDIEAEKGGYEADDVMCDDGQYDVYLDKDFKVTKKVKED